MTAYKRYEVNLDTFVNVRRWFDAIKSRPAVRKGIEAGKEARSFGGKMSKEHLKTLFAQGSKSVNKIVQQKRDEKD